MDGPSSFFFSLEQIAGQEKLMKFLKNSNGHNTSDPVIMRRLAVNFYSDLYASKPSDEQCRRLLLEDLPVLTPELNIFSRLISLLRKSLLQSWGYPQDVHQDWIECLLNFIEHSEQN